MRSLRRPIIILLLALILLGGVFASPKPAQALFGIGDVSFTTIIANIPQKIQDAISKALKTVVAVAYKNGLQYFANKFAYDLANNLAFGCPGGKPCFIVGNFGDYIKETGDAALGEFLTTGVNFAIEELTASEPIEECAKYCITGIKTDTDGVFCDVYAEPGVDPPRGMTSTDPRNDQVQSLLETCVAKNKEIQERNARTQASRAKTKDVLKKTLTLCQPISIDINARIQLAARGILEPQKPACTFSKMRKAWGIKTTTVRINGRDIRQMDFSGMQLKDLPGFSAYYDPNENDLGATLQIIAQGQQVKQFAEQASIYERTENKGYKPTEDFITKERKTPTDLKVEQYRKGVDVPLSTIYKGYTGEVLADAIGTFTNTLVSKMLKRILETGFNPKTDRSLATFGPSSGSIGFTQGASLAFADLIPGNFAEGPGVLLADLTSEGPGPENRVFNEDFRIAVDNQLTLTEATSFNGREAIQCPRCQKLISVNSTFGFNANGTQPDWRTDIPYRSIVILRKHRIVPVGWELAALYMKNYGGERKTLGQLMSEYDNCGPNGSPYCRLVDPNWVLKAPVSKCYRYGPGEENLAALTAPICDTDTDGSGGPPQCPPDIAAPPIQRNEYCADQRTCVVGLPGGGCANEGFQQCVEEKQVWKTDAASCPAYYASCQEYVKQGSGERVSFLTNTTDSTGCVREASLGCRRYARTTDPGAGGWKDSVAAADNYFLNDQALDAAKAACGNARSLGCKEYLRVRHLDEARHPYTVAEYQSLVGSAGSGGYIDPTREVQTMYYNSSAKVCSQQYVGCALFTTTDPAGTQIQIPAMPNYATIDPNTGQVANWNDECPAVCVGYQKFEQLATNFEPGIALNPGVNMIPSTARQCPASDVGCDEFTNLDEVARGGEGREYYTELRECQKPGSGGAAYYTWQGDDTKGFQLKDWELRPQAGTVGPPQVVGPKLERVDPTKGWNGIDCEGDFNSANPDPDCREFVDTQLNYYYRYFSKTILASNDCHPLRRTLDGKVYNAIPSLSRTCPASSAGCREYRGASGGNTQAVFSDAFEGGSFAPWEGQNLTISTESALRNNHSLKIPNSAQRRGVPVKAGVPYSIAFWGKAEGSPLPGVMIRVFNGASMVAQYNPAVTGEWGQFRAGPFSVPADAGIDIYFFRVGTAGAVYADNVLMQTANLYAIKNSWQTPVVCDQPVPGYHLGCTAYSSGGQNYAFRGFSNLCPQEFVGCEALIDTQNSRAAGPASFYAGTASAVTVPADTLAFLVPGEGARCEALQKGCGVYGKSSLRSDGSVVYTDTVVQVDPDTFGDTSAQPLTPGTAPGNCTLEEEYCAAWDLADATSSSLRFKDPTGLTCEYKTENGVATWYAQGTSTPCPTMPAAGVCSNAPYRVCGGATGGCPAGGTCRPLGRCVGGRSIHTNLTLRGLNQCEKNTDCADYSRPGGLGICSTSVGLCDSGSSTCTEYQDPQSPKGCLNTLVYGQRACERNTARFCQADEGCKDRDAGGTVINDYGNCSVLACDTVYLPKKGLRDALGACTAINPDIGCVGLHEVGGGPDTITTTPHCENDATKPCASPADCGGAACGYQ